MYDWLFEDIGIANEKFSFDYNRLYDLYFKLESLLNLCM